VRFATTTSSIRSGDEGLNSDENVFAGKDRSGSYEADSGSGSEGSYSSDEAYDEGEEEEEEGDADAEGFFGAVEGVLGNFAAYLKVAW
jgi:hypothetical protein